MRNRLAFRRLMLALFAALGACADEKAEVLTAIVVAVDSDISGLESVTVDVENFGDPELVGGDLSDAGGERLPKHVGLVHRGGPLGPITIIAKGYRGGTLEVINRRSRVHFVENKTMLLRLNLLESCRGELCGGDAELTCTERGCVSIDTPANELTEWKGEIPPLIVDVNGDDAGTDAGSDAGGPMPDAGHDAGGVDAGPMECAYPMLSCDLDDDCETNVLDDVDNCGDCGEACPAIGTDQVIGRACTNGECSITCDLVNYGNCDSDVDTGCETNLQTSQTHCGACGAACTVTNGEGECVGGDCTIGSCTTGWDDCNGGLDCERDVTAPEPDEMGGFGPCLPDTDCVHVRRGDAITGTDYYFCPTPHNYDEARDHCQSQRFGDLVHIDDDEENTFVKDNLAAASWLGASDGANEGAWRWANDTLQFWSGDGAGDDVDDLYGNWLAGEPQTNGDCAQMLQSGADLGFWSTDDCAGLKAFVCEVQIDACATDTTKQSPMQCGCDVPDVHMDSDGVADCDDPCPTDSAKLDPGVCGCGVAEVLTDTDNDGTPDCIDLCQGDANKVAPGVCGCGNPETDTTAPCAYEYVPTNFDPVGIFAGAPDVNCTVAVPPFDTSGTPPLAAVTVCNTTITPVVQAQVGGPELWILPMNSLNVAAGVTLRFVGPRPVVLAVANDATIAGTLDVSAQNTTPTTTPGAGGNVSCAVGSGQGTDGVFVATSNIGDGGGGGGGFRTAGGTGGNGNNVSGTSGGAAGTIVADQDLSPLRGGCRGGAVVPAIGNVNGAGSGGGAIELAVGGTLTLSASAVVAAAGSGGLKGSNHEDGGGGGGSGGAILLEAEVLSIHADAWITANGGGGAGGNQTDSGSGATGGANGGMTSTARAAGGTGANSGNNDSDGGNGGLGGALAGAPTNGANGTVRGCSLGCGTEGGGGGGGGGSAGVIRIHGYAPGCSAPSTRVSPAATLVCQ